MEREKKKGGGRKEGENGSVGKIIRKKRMKTKRVEREGGRINNYIIQERERKKTLRLSYIIAFCLTLNIIKMGGVKATHRSDRSRDQSTNANRSFLISRSRGTILLTIIHEFSNRRF